MASTIAPPRILIASLGVGVPDLHADLLAGALAREAEQLGYLRVSVENGQVSGSRPPQAASSPDLGGCPDCLREIGRYPSGKLYRHACAPAGAVLREFQIELPYRELLLSENYRLHRLEVAKRVKQLRHDGYYLAKSAKVPRMSRVMVELHWQPVVRRSRDQDNPNPMIKALCDGLTDAGVVSDDTYTQMQKRIVIHEPDPDQATVRLWLQIAGLWVPPETTS